MPPNPQRKPRRACPRAAALRLAVLVTLGLVATACTSTPASKNSTAPPVLGQRAGRAAVVGQPAPAGTGQLDAVSCAGAERCWAVGTAGATSPQTVVDATFDGGRTWVAQPLRLAPAPSLTAISCPGVKLCLAVGLNGSASAGIVVATHDRGSTWSAVAVPAGATVLTSVQCQSAVDCTVIASDGTTFWSAHSVDFGRTWDRGGTLPAGLQSAGSLACVSGGSCLVTGFTATTTGHGEGAIAVSGDGGTTWKAADVPADTGILRSVYCTSATSCLAAGTTSTTVNAIVPAVGEMLQSVDGGQTWARSLASPSIDDVAGIVCPSARLCAVVGTDWVGHPAVGTGAVAQSRNGGRSFVASASEYTPLPLIALACPSVRSCLGVGGDTVARITLGQPQAVPALTPARPAGGVHRPPLGGRD